MARLVVLFEDGKALVDGIEADAIGTHVDLPFLTEEARLAAARAAMAGGDQESAERVAERDVVSPVEKQRLLTFRSPPDWDTFGANLWDQATGQVHAVFTSGTMLVEGVAAQGCVGLPFADEDARRDCALWCLRNGLDGIAERVARTPVGGDGPHCTWPDEDLPVEEEQTPPPTEPPLERVPEASEADAGTNVVELFGRTFSDR